MADEVQPVLNTSPELIRHDFKIDVLALGTHLAGSTGVPGSTIIHWANSQGCSGEGTV
jgi:hypothetical protein